MRSLRPVAAAVALFALVGCSASSLPFRGRAKEPYRYDLDYGESVIIRNGLAVAPRHAPPEVHRVVAAGNRLLGRPYKLGGGHARLEDSGYDCSGAVSYVLIRAGLLGSPMPSKGFRDFGRRGEGDWVTVYAKDGHTFLTVGGLRFDTGYRGDARGPTWTTRPRPTRGYRVRHPRGL